VKHTHEIGFPLCKKRVPTEEKERVRGKEDRSRRRRHGVAPSV